MRIDKLLIEFANIIQGSKHKGAKKTTNTQSKQSHILPHSSVGSTRRNPHASDLGGYLNKLKKYYHSPSQGRGQSLSMPKIFLLFGSASLFLVLSSVYYWVFESRYFLVSSSRVIIESLDPFVDMSKAYESIGSIYGAPIYRVKQENIEDLIQNDQNHIQNIEVNRLWPNGLQIILESQKPIATLNFIDTTKRLYLSQSGVIMTPDPTGSIQINEETLLPVVLLPHDKLPIVGGKRSLRPIFVESLSYIRAFLSNRNGMIGEKKITAIHILEEEQELHLIADGLRIMLIADKNLITQLRELTILLTEKPEAINTSWYVDMRVPRKAFACSDRVTCSQNIRTIYPKYQALSKTP